MVVIKRLVNIYFRQYEQSIQYILSIKVLETILCNEILPKINLLGM